MSERRWPTPDNLVPVEQVFEDGRELGVLHRQLGKASLGGAEFPALLDMDGQTLTNFGDCGYMGLSQHPDVRQGAADAALEWGAQFSSSRAYMSNKFYGELEDEQLTKIFDGRPALVAPSTTLIHQTALPALIHDTDAIIYDPQAHASIQQAVRLVAPGARREVTVHNDMDRLEQKIQQLRPNHRKIWYLADGVYSMYADVVDMPRLHELLDAYPQLCAYVDDAHGMSWTGEHGKGMAASQVDELHERLFLAISLSKAFGASGGAILCPDQESRQLIRDVGSPLTFGIPLGPPALGAAVASANLHLQPEFSEMQAELADRIAHTQQRLDDSGIPTLSNPEVPIFFAPVGIPRRVQETLQGLKQDGYFADAAIYPAVPQKRGGIRFTVTNHLHERDIDGFVDSLARQIGRTVVNHPDFNQAKFERLFRLPPGVMDQLVERQFPSGASPEMATTPELTVTHRSTIGEIDQSNWGRAFNQKGWFDANGLALQEKVFAHSTPDVQKWPYGMVTASDAAGDMVAATHYTVPRLKYDLFEPAWRSRIIEERRQELSDPTYLSDPIVMLGSPLSVGEHMHIDRQNPQWQAAVKQVIDQLQDVRERHHANGIILRDFDQNDPELEEYMANQGFTKIPQRKDMELLEVNFDEPWQDWNEYAAKYVDRKYRTAFRNDIVPSLDNYDTKIDEPLDEQAIQDCISLYKNVAQRKAADLSLYQLPDQFFHELAQNENADIIRLYAKDNPDDLAAVLFCHANDDVYSPLFIGADYEFITGEKGRRLGSAYKAVTAQAIKRANQKGCRKVALGVTARTTKRQLGGKPRPTQSFVQYADNAPFEEMYKIT